MASVREPEASSVSDQPSVQLHRRQFLRQAGWTLGAVGLGQMVPLRHALAHRGQEGELPVWAAAVHNGQRVALGRKDGVSAVFEIHVESNGAVNLGDRITQPFDDDFAALSIASFGADLVLGGSELYEIERLVIDNRHETIRPEDREALLDDPDPPTIFEVPVLASRPAVYHLVGGGQLRQLPIHADWRWPHGYVSSIASIGNRRLVGVVDSADDIEANYGDVVCVAESNDAGSTWSFEVLASGLGEGFWSHVTVSGGLLALLTDHIGATRVYERDAAFGAPWSSVQDGNLPGGPVLAATSARGVNHVYVEEVDHGVHRLEYRNSRWVETGVVVLDGEDAIDVISVNGGGGEVLVLGKHSAELRAS